MRLTIRAKKKKKKFGNLRLVCLLVGGSRYDVYYFGSYVGYIYSPVKNYYAFLNRMNFLEKTARDLDTLKALVRKSLDSDIGYTI